MSLSVRVLRGAVVAGLSFVGVAAPAVLHAQKAERTGAPVGGTWGAEAGVGVFDNASVIRFLSPQWAVLVGGSISTTNSTGSGSTRVEGRTSSSLQAGLRRYHGSGLGFRPISGFGVSYNRLSDVTSTGGIYGEAGAAYLFNPHVSVGAIGRVGFSRDGDRNTVSALVPRLNVSIFF